MGFIENIVSFIPEVKAPSQKKLAFKDKFKWTLLILILFFTLGTISLFGLDPNYESQFEQFSLILGAQFGSIISLGIGPIVTASIVLQLLNGSGLIKFDTSTQEGRKKFQGTQKLLAIFFVVFEAIVYVYFGGFAPPSVDIVGLGMFNTLRMVLIGQLILGGLLIMIMDEVIQKWGFGSGIGLFIIANVAQEIFVQAFSPLNATGSLYLGSGQEPIGKLWQFFIFLSQNNPNAAYLAAAAIIATVVVFLASVYMQAMKIEIPLSFGRVRGYGMRWPLKFMYTSNMPVILIAALLANFQLWAQLMEGLAVKSSSAILNFISVHILGQVNTAQTGGGIVQFVNPPNLVQALITNSLSWPMMQIAIGYILLMTLGSMLFALFWVQTSGQDAHNQAKNIMKSGLQIPGFRKDARILERILQRYIGPLTIMGGLAVGILASLADLSGALSRGTGILLAVMITYQIYEEIAKQHMMDMNPMMRKMFE